MITTEARLLGRNKKHVWLRIPWKNGAYRILTLPRSFLPRGMATADWLTIEYDPRSIRSYTEEELQGGFTGEVKILNAIWRQSNEGSEEDGRVQGST